MRTFRNDRSGQTITTSLSNEELALAYAKVAGDSDWLWFWIAKKVESTRAATPAARDMTDFIADLFVIAVGRGLKTPMIRLGNRAANRRYKLYLSKYGTVCVKAGNVAPGTMDPVGDEEYIGKFKDGRFQGDKFARPSISDLAFIEEMTADPIATFVRASKDMDRCCYCNLPLEDARSKQVGYGAVCATRWGLPWGTGRTEEVPSFATLWGKADAESRKNVRGICLAIRQNPADKVNWLVLRDALSEAGWPDSRLPEQPDTVKVVVPRA